MTIADFSIYETVISLDIIIPIDKTKYPYVFRWTQEVNELPKTVVYKQGFLEFKTIVTTLLKGN